MIRTIQAKITFCQKKGFLLKCFLDSFNAVKSTTKTENNFKIDP